MPAFANTNLASFRVAMWDAAPSLPAPFVSVGCDNVDVVVSQKSFWHFSLWGEFSGLCFLSPSEWRLKPSAENRKGSYVVEAFSLLGGGKRDRTRLLRFGEATSKNVVSPREGDCRFLGPSAVTS